MQDFFETIETFNLAFFQGLAVLIALTAALVGIYKRILPSSLQDKMQARIDAVLDTLRKIQFLKYHQTFYAKLDAGVSNMIGKPRRFKYYDDYFWSSNKVGVSLLLSSIPLWISSAIHFGGQVYGIATFISMYKIFDLGSKKQGVRRVVGCLNLGGLSTVGIYLIVGSFLSTIKSNSAYMDMFMDFGLNVCAFLGTLYVVMFLPVLGRLAIHRNASVISTTQWLKSNFLLIGSSVFFTLFAVIAIDTGSFVIEAGVSRFLGAGTGAGSSVLAYQIMVLSMGAIIVGIPFLFTLSFLIMRVISLAFLAVVNFLLKPLGTKHNYLYVLAFSLIYLLGSYWLLMASVFKKTS